MVIEAVIFYSQVEYQIAPYYPSGFDQASYYVQTYNLIEDLTAHGWIAVVNDTLRSPSSLLFNLQGALFAMAFGKNRTAIIGVNLLYFCALQVTLFLTVRRATGKTYAAWLAVSLLLAARSMFFGNAGIYAYQMDFCALCLYGILACLIVHSQVIADLVSTLAITVAASAPEE